MVRRLAAGIGIAAVLALPGSVGHAGAIPACVPNTGNARVCVFRHTDAQGNSKAEVFVINHSEVVATLGLYCQKDAPKSHYALKLNGRPLYGTDLAAKCPKL
jgi:hypothetical protein